MFSKQKGGDRVKNKVTIRDVAKAVGVSPSAVTIALSGKNGVSEQTKERILQTAQKMGYSRASAQPAVRRSRNIHYVIPRYLLEVDRANVPVYHDLLMQSIEKSCRENSCFMVVHYLGQDPDEVDAVIRSIRSVEDDPMVIVQAADLKNETVSQWIGAIPRVVFINKYFIKQQVDCVASDGIGIVYAATSYLIERGYSQIGFFYGRTYFKNLADRREGYLRCLEDHGMQSAGIWQVHTSYEQAYQEVRQYLQQGVVFPRAIVCVGDRQAIGAIRAFREAGLRVPEDIAVIGFDGLPLAAEHDPPLSTCSVTWEEMAQTAVERVLEKTGAPGERNRKVLIGAILQPGGTT